MSKFHDVYMGTALLHAKKSKAVRLQVGAVIVTKSGVIIPGYNGTPAGTDNNCEDLTKTGLVTKKSVIHAELNCVLKAAKEGIPIDGAVAYITHAPCLQCAAMLKQAGIKHVMFGMDYRDDDGVNFLRNNGVPCDFYSVDDL